MYHQPQHLSIEFPEISEKEEALQTFPAVKLLYYYFLDAIGRVSQSILPDIVLQQR
jgi:hypothetical protein